MRATARCTTAWFGPCSRPCPDTPASGARCQCQHRLLGRHASTRVNSGTGINSREQDQHGLVWCSCAEARQKHGLRLRNKVRAQAGRLSGGGFEDRLVKEEWGGGLEDSRMGEEGSRVSGRSGSQRG
eukprot:2430270-Rhodomonas_salina.4